MWWYRFQCWSFNYLDKKGFDLCWPKWFMFTGHLSLPDDNDFRTISGCDYCGHCMKWKEPIGEYVHFPGYIENGGA